MKSKAKTVAEYIKGVPADRRASFVTVRTLILKNLPKGYEESVGWGMPVYQVPLKVYPDTYNKQPLMYAALASQKNYLALYLCNVYGLSPLREKLVAAFKAAGKKLDMGKSCIRFQSADDLPLKAIGQIVASTPMAAYVAFARKVHER